MTGPRTDVRRSRRGGYAGPTAIIILVLLLIGGGAYAYVQSNKTSTINVPYVIGQTVTSATGTLRAQGFVVSTDPVHSKKPKNTVISTNPKAGKALPKGSAVQLTVSLGVSTSPVTIPNLVGMSVANAESLLTHDKLGYNPSETSNATAGEIPNTVLSQTPTSGTKSHSGVVVTIVFLAPGSKYPVADVDGYTQIAATAKLTQQGLTVGPNIGQVCSNTVTQGLVVSTNPPANALVTANWVVKLVVSSGPCQMVMPTVVGDTEAQATAALSAQGLTPNFTNDPTALCPAGSPITVTQQSVAGGSPVTYGSTVGLEICQNQVP
jgi:serine/threonine-protein kinase